MNIMYFPNIIITIYCLYYFLSFESTVPFFSSPKGADTFWRASLPLRSPGRSRLQWVSIMYLSAPPPPPGDL